MCEPGELLEHYQYGLTFSLFLLEERASAGGTDSSVVDPAGGGMREVSDAIEHGPSETSAGLALLAQSFWYLRRTVK